MSQQIKETASRIKELRKITNTSVEQMANDLEITPNEYSIFESGNSDIPLSILFKIAAKFNVELTTLLTGGDPKLHTYSLVRKDKGLDVKRREAYKYQNLAYNFIHKKAEPFLVTVEPNQEDKALILNSHPGQEFNYVLEGTLKITINNHELILNEGDSLFFDSNSRHGMQALNNKPAKFLAIIL